MEGFCPLCLQNGAKKKIKLFQINLQEGVWACEEEKCMWPFGYDDFTFCPRIVGKKWSYDWDDKKPPIVTNQGVFCAFTEPALNNSFTSYEYTPNQSNSCLQNYSSSIETTNNYVDIKDCSNFNVKVEIPTSNDDAKGMNTDGNIQHINTSELHTNHIGLINDNTESVKGTEENSIEPPKVAKEFRNITVQNIQNKNNGKDLSKLMTISAKNTDNLNIVSQDLTSNQQDNIKRDCNFIKRENNIMTNVTPSQNLKTSSNILRETQKCTTSKSPENNSISEIVAKPNLQVTLMKVDGLPPITVSYEIADMTSQTVTSNTEHSNLSIVSQDDSTTLKDSLVYANPFERTAKDYAKFSFRAIKKAMEVKKNCSIINNSANNGNIDAISKSQNANNLTNITKKDNCDESPSQTSVSHNKNYDQATSITNIHINESSHHATDSKILNNLSNETNLESADTTSVNINVNIDSIVDNFLADNSITEDINDEWIQTLLGETGD